MGTTLYRIIIAVVSQMRYSMMAPAALLYVAIQTGKTDSRATPL
jgi:uncharacterized ion transporter superfamily protein YfcC